MGAAASCFPCKKKRQQNIAKISKKSKEVNSRGCHCKFECCLHADFQDETILKKFWHQNSVENETEMAVNKSLHYFNYR